MVQSSADGGLDRMWVETRSGPIIQAAHPPVHPPASGMFLMMGRLTTPSQSVPVSSHLAHQGSLLRLHLCLLRVHLERSQNHTLLSQMTTGSHRPCAGEGLRVRNVTAAECLPHRKRLAEASEMLPRLRHLVEATERSHLRVVLIIGANLLMASLVAMIGPVPMPEIPAGIEKKIVVTPQ